MLLAMEIMNDEVPRRSAAGHRNAVAHFAPTPPPHPRTPQDPLRLPLPVTREPTPTPPTFGGVGGGSSVRARTSEERQDGRSAVACKSSDLGFARGPGEGEAI